MPKRKSVQEMECSWTSAIGEAVAFIPDLRVMGHLTARECLEMVRKDWGVRGSLAVCLPLIGVDGVSFENGLFPPKNIRAKVDSSTATPKTVGQIARDFVDLGCNLYLYVVPTMPFIQVESCHVLDIRGKGTPEACVHRAKTKEFLGYLIACGIDHVQDHLEDDQRITGLVVDITDLWGGGGEGGKVYLTCFCDECRHYLLQKRLPLPQFETFPNPWELALKSTRTGIDFIDNISYGETAPSIVGKANLRGFGERFLSESDRTHAAELLMQYMVARHEMTEDFLAAVFKEATVVGSDDQARPLKKVALVEGVEHDWTAGVFPRKISPAVIDELWLDPSDRAPSIECPHKMFMWRRASYFLNAFFDFLTSVADPRTRTTTGIARLSMSAAKALLRERGAKATSNELKGVQQLAALPALQGGQCNGFVAVVFSEELLRPLLANAYIAPGLGGHASEGIQTVPPGLLQAIVSAMQRGEVAGEEDEEAD